MTIAEFIKKWRKVELKERSAAQQHFCDLCEALGHPKPADADPVGSEFCFEKGATKLGGHDGWADVWKRGFFGWEYKGKHSDLEKAYGQLLLYRESLENPPLLIVSDMDRIVIRTNFTNTPTVIHELDLDTMLSPDAIETLKAAFFKPESLKPTRTRQFLTEEAAARITDIAKALRKRGEAPQKVARFLDRIVFCLFAQDVGLLPEGLFRQLVDNAYKEPLVFAKRIGELFSKMATGGDFGVHAIKYFNGDLFADVEVLALNDEELLRLRDIARANWADVDASIFGTLFERALDPNKREQLGAHYTSREDIETIIVPVVMEPLRKEWATVREQVTAQLARTTNVPSNRKAAALALSNFVGRLQHVSVLDPACGSGNFLYVVLQHLKNLEKEVILFAMQNDFPGFFPHVGPWQLNGIETNAYAFELAQMTVWIGWLQWIMTNGFGEPQEPVLQKLHTFQHRDAIIDVDPSGLVIEPAWPDAEFIVGNPPFLGTKKLRASLGDEYVDRLFALYGDRIPNFSDLCCYWFEKARALVEEGKCKRAGLLATQGIRGGLNREVLNRIKKTGDIFFGVSDRDWVLDGANVHVSMVGFDRGEESRRVLDGQEVPVINANLTSKGDTTKAREIKANLSIGFVADVKSGKFDLPFDQAIAMLSAPNPNGRPNSDVLRPWVNSLDVLRKPRNVWIVDFPSAMPSTEAARYEQPFEWVKREVYPERSVVKRKAYRDYWWIHAEPCDAMRQASKAFRRVLVTPTVSKHRLFAWLDAPILPDHQLIVFATDEDYLFGLLHSRVHELWARKTGTQLREVESGFRYTPTSTFETFPMPPKTPESAKAVSEAARSLEEARHKWLFPPQWTKTVSIDFSASTDGIWAAFIVGNTSDGIGTARYSRRVPTDSDILKSYNKRTLTNLYNQNPTWLQDAHRLLNEAVLSAYGWPSDISDDKIIERLIVLNLEQASNR